MPTDPLHTRLCEEYNCEVPMVAFAHTKDVIAAVSNAGAIGMLGGVLSEPDELRSDIRWIKERVGDKPFGVDLLLPASFVEGKQKDLESQIPQGHQDFVSNLMKDNEIPEPKTPEPWGQGGSQASEIMKLARAQLDVLLDEGVPIFASGLGSPAFIMDELHERGIKVWSLVGLPRQAKRLVDADIDLIVAQGGDAGGHSGTIGTFSLIPQVVDVAKEKDIPVLAAGGAMDGRHLAAAIMLGAVGTWSGTIWQATNEASWTRPGWSVTSETDMYLKQKMVDARVEDAIHSRAATGKPVRQLRSKWTEAWSQEGAPQPLQMPLQEMLVAKIQQSIIDWDSSEWMQVSAGQGVGLIDSVKPARQIVFDTAEGARDAFERTTGAEA